MYSHRENVPAAGGWLSSRRLATCHLATSWAMHILFMYRQCVAPEFVLDPIKDAPLKSRLMHTSYNYLAAT